MLSNKKSAVFGHILTPLIIHLILTPTVCILGIACSQDVGCCCSDAVGLSLTNGARNEPIVVHVRVVNKVRIRGVSPGTPRSHRDVNLKARYWMPTVIFQSPFQYNWTISKAVSTKIWQLRNWRECVSTWLCWWTLCTLCTPTCTCMYADAKNMLSSVLSCTTFSINTGISCLQIYLHCLACRF